jgi:hypothetical protein
MKSALYLAAAAATLSLPMMAKAETFAQVVIYDVKPGSEGDFERALLASRQGYQAKAAFINERLLASLDAQALKYASYAKFNTEAAANTALEERVRELGPFLRRQPEAHIVALSHSFLPAGQVPQPRGTEFGLGRTGQVAHLGLFVPFNKFWSEYQTSLVDVKKVIVGRKPHGYLGDDLLVETVAPEPAIQAPYSPRPAEAAKMSVNYGEFASLEDAENAYVQRHSKLPDPKVSALTRVFFGSLQVPSRFFIFRVVDNYGAGVGAQVRQSLRTKVAFRD